MSVRLSFLLVLLLAVPGPSVALGQALHKVAATGDDFTVVSVQPGAEGKDQVIRTDSKGATLATWTLPFAANALCVHATGTVIAPADGGLALLDAAGQVKTRVAGLVYDSVVCHGAHAYAAGRTLRVHRFELPSLANRTTVLEANLWITRLIMPRDGLLAAASWDGGVWILDTTDGTRRAIPGKDSLLDLSVGPGGTWITLSEEGQILTLREIGTPVHRFKSKGARRLAVSSTGVLAVLVETNTVALHRQSGVRWVESSRLRLPKPAAGSAPLPLGAGRWVILTTDGPFFFADTP